MLKRTKAKMLEILELLIREVKWVWVLCLPSDIILGIWIILNSYGELIGIHLTTFPELGIMADI